MFDFCLSLTSVLADLNWDSIVWLEGPLLQEEVDGFSSAARIETSSKASAASYDILLQNHWMQGTTKT
jgi:hypothetical protein